uniref:Pentacotripeptide-repeat region of PRORP domain-containing protein n=1 Tax=Globisporangium ultimum (strain ATCC 200006 / CBS 805.95 / DAOM BR144) TaxID=431595 RepID=K3XBI2_GLOUD
MWNACRAAALRQLQRHATPAAASVRSGTRFAITAQTAPPLGRVHHFTNVAGIDRDFILSRSTKELRMELGNAQIAKLQQALATELSSTIAKDDVTVEEIKDLFAAAQKTKATQVMLRAFEFLQETFPNKIDFSIFGEVFRLMMKARDGEKMFSVYEQAKPRFQTTPEMIYRFGIVGKLEQGELDAASEIWEEMVDAGHETPNEISSRMLFAYARDRNADKVLELYESIDPQIGQWHESAIDRVILSLGMIGEPQKAFEFYINSSMKLNGGTLIALLSVCINNNCHQQAADILDNRKRFDLQLDARAYNRIMATLEFLDKHAEIADVLEEMRANKVRFDTMTRNIIERNQAHLQGTPFAAGVEASAQAVETKTGVQPKKPSSYFAGPKIRDLLDQNEGTQAAALVEEFVKPLQETDLPEGVKLPKGALKVAPSLAKDAVRAYIMSGDHGKVAKLLESFCVLEGKYGHALAEIMVHYGKVGPDQNETLAYKATKALLTHGRQIFRVDDALALFRKFKDVESTTHVFEQVIDEFAENKQKLMQHAESGAATPAVTPEEARSDKKRFSQFNIGRVINMTLQTYVENAQLQKALDALEYLGSHNLEPNAFNYAVVFNTMRDQDNIAARRGKKQKSNKTQAAYSADQYELVWEDMRRRNVAVNKSIVGNVCSGFASGNKRQRLKLLEAYAEAKTSESDKYVLPPNCYTILLQLTAQEGDLAGLKALYEDAVQSLADKDADRRLPREWVNTLAVNLTRHGEVDEAHSLLMQMEETTGGFSYEALTTVLRAVAKTSDKEKTARLFKIVDDNKFRLNLQDSYDLVHTARDQNQPQLALEILRVFEAGHIDEARPTEFHHINMNDQRAATKLRTMYRVALNLCEQNGQWKNALQLRERVAELLGEDMLAEKSAKMTPNSTESTSADQ